MIFPYVTVQLGLEGKVGTSGLVRGKLSCVLEVSQSMKRATVSGFRTWALLGGLYSDVSCRLLGFRNAAALSANAEKGNGNALEPTNTHRSD